MPSVGSGGARFVQGWEGGLPFLSWVDGLERVGLVQGGRLNKERVPLWVGPWERLVSELGNCCRRGPAVRG